MHGAGRCSSGAPSQRGYKSRHGRMLLHDGRALKALLKEYLDLDVLISLEKLPPDWELSMIE